MHKGSVIEDLIASVELVESRWMFPVCMQDQVRVHATYTYEFSYAQETTEVR